MKIRCGTQHLYLEMQKGGNIPIFRGIHKQGGFSFRFLKPLSSMFGKLLFHMVKQVVKKVAPDILDTALQVGQDIMKGNKIKSVAKKAMSQTARTLGRSTRQTLEDEVARHASQKRWKGGDLMLKRTQNIKGMLKRS